MPEQAHLKIYGHGKVEIELVVSYLADLKYAYDGVSVFLSEVDTLRRSARDLPFPPYPFWNPRVGRYVREIPTPERVASFVPRAEQIVLDSVQLNSPGFWEFMGSLNPLEVLRKYLNDRHERRKDHDYRESAERGQRGIFPKEHAKGVSAIGHGFPLPKPLIFSFGGLGGRLAEQVARDVDQREPPPFFGQFGGVGLDEYLDGLVAGINFDTQRAALEIDFVTPSRFTANNCMGHLRSYERLKG